ncbi:hypothetical protein C8K30_103154 [Promicromonospora sp. AC04]|uniref:hypothetical protein n=1 Tax=Promicromonospora sp. AC04 TaxID=2135723 RepID=UPI000D397E27|nr:hypothetical protein [Promicromonospora sp. AC04]PUB28733.1 hypothetical protein C8K30_103154 [Promicromonospora sp. AC04]
MTLSELIDLCESRINELSRKRHGFEHLDVPEYVEILIDDLRASASGWDAAAVSPPDGNPAAVRGNAQAVRAAAEGLRTLETALRGHATVVLEAQGLDAMADTLDDYATALESGQSGHSSGLADLRAAQQDAAGLPSVSSHAGPEEVSAASTAALAVLDAACAGYAVCQDAYQAVLDAEEALRAALSDAGTTRGSTTRRPAEVQHHMRQRKSATK